MLFSYGQSSNSYIISPINILYTSSTSINLIASETVNTSTYSLNMINTQGFLQPENFIFLGVENMVGSFFRFYPNPVIDGIYVEFKNDCGENMNCTFYNFLGQKVKEIEINLRVQNKVYFRLSDLEQGVYLMTIIDIDKGNRSTSKLIKQ